MGYCATIVRPRFIITTVVISGIILAAFPLVHHIGPALLVEEDQEEGKICNVYVSL